MTFYTSAEGASDIFLCVGYLIRISISHVDFEKIERIIVQKCATYEIIVAFFFKNCPLAIYMYLCHLPYEAVKPASPGSVSTTRSR